MLADRDLRQASRKYMYFTREEFSQAHTKATRFPRHRSGLCSCMSSNRGSLRMIINAICLERSLQGTSTGLQAGRWTVGEPVIFIRAVYGNVMSLKPYRVVYAFITRYMLLPFKVSGDATQLMFVLRDVQSSKSEMFL